MCLAFLVLPLLLSSIPFNKECTLVMLCSYVCFLMCLTSLVLPLLLFSIPFNKEYLLDGGLKKRSQTVKPRFYPSGCYADFALLPDDDRTIDLEACPKCGGVALVYDCTNESCQNQRDHTATECRACYLCIPRCDVCGKCLHGEYVDIYYLERRCLDCARTYGSDDWVELEIYKLPRISTRRIVV